MEKVKGQNLQFRIALSSVQGLPWRVRLKVHPVQHLVSNTGLQKTLRNCQAENEDKALPRSVFPAGAEAS